ncbi:hypothetical protein INT47_000769 [Mucor saturninus]|uniref:S-adenosyl-L-methionine-dependent methyltransferase n=1 Tax=Mucor saturninus TaxID=64648 RepID=A0A8H7QLX3_9FUNG|nr:hypothetical protein INT47_000769 [Mucor saturninus]
MGKILSKFCTPNGEEITLDDATQVKSSREFHVHTDDTVTYWLPKDDEELNRVMGQHFAIKDLYEGRNILKSVEKSLDFEKGIAILDLGCGPGSWILDMITDYPNCTYEGCDIVNSTNKNITPKQFNWKYGNFLERIDYPDNTFDFIHMRLLLLSVREVDWPIVLKEALRVLKPGGFIQWKEFDLKMTGDGNEAIEKFMNGIHFAMRSRGQDPRIALQSERLLTETNAVKIIEKDYRSIDMTSNTNAAKKFLWDWKETCKSMLPVLGPAIGIEDKVSQEAFLKDIMDGLVTCESYTYMNAVAAQKL